MKDWKQFIELERGKKYFKDLQGHLDKEYENYTIYPEKENIFYLFQIL